MAPIDNKKRKVPPKVAAMKAKKRQKLEGGGAPPSKLVAKPRKSTFKVEDLAWKTVSMPDRMDDWEGLNGELEEIDGVDVEWDGKGIATFSAVAGAGPTSNGGATAEDGDDDGDDGEEWSGFGSEEDSPPEAKAKRTDEKPEKETHSKKRDRKQKKTENANTTKPAPNGIFQSLADNNQDDDDEAADISAWRPLNLSPDTLSSLSKLKFPQPTPIQQSAIPEILAGEDVIGKASTGSGKTLAFGIPILETFLERQRTKYSSSAEKSPIALILSPTRELAHQLDKHLTALCSNGNFQGPTIATLTGGLSVQKQQRLLKNADVVIGTPGRLWEVISSGQGIIQALKQMQFLVVDEADRLLSEGHFKEAEEILNALDRKEETDDGDNETVTPEKQDEDNHRQTLVFSATFDRNLQRKLATKSKSTTHNLQTNAESLEYLLSKLNFRSPKPKFLDVNPVNALATGLKEGLIECGGTEKDLYLYTLLLLHPNVGRTLVFVNSISAVRRITPFLQNLNLNALALHSGMPQKARMRSVERFTASNNTNGGSSPPILIATDVAARGLDIPDIHLVIHYHLPRAADTYVHRSGRTARAGSPGTSILLCAPDEVAGVRRLVAKVHTGKDPTSQQAQGNYYIRTLDPDRRLISRLKPRATLAKRIADAGLAQSKGKKEDDFFRSAAEDLGVEYDSSHEGSGRGAGRKRKEREARGLSKGEVQGMRAELRGLLAQRVNVGVSERYLTAGGRVDVGELLRQGAAGTDGKGFLGGVGGLLD